MFLSDIHLGSKGCQASEVADLLKHIRCEKLYLVGDIVDMWRLKQRWHWPAEHNDVIRQILKAAKRGTEVIFIPGNHDEWARDYIGLNFGGVHLAMDDVHETADGRRLLISHGDQYDMVVKHARLLSMLGAWAYDTLLSINRWYNAIRLRLGMKYWSLSKYLKSKVKSACVYVSRFEETLMDEARRKKLDGVVCGHIHHPEVRRGDIDYYNCGDWVESCTALVEHEDGTLNIIDGIALVQQLREKGVEAPGREADALAVPAI
jgi:UDP-2,3-diacylglucosamine pyrophosphatase LpxH